MKKPREEHIIEALEKSGGIIKTASSRLDVSRKTLYDWIKKSEVLTESLLDCREMMVDISEGALYNQIKEGNMTGIIFHLKTQGKSRGYVERMEYDTKNTVEITGITFDEPS